MLKKMLVTSAVAILASNMVIAAPAPYVGASLGIINNTSNFGAIQGSNSKVELSSFRGLPFNVFAGYGGMINQNLYLAGELGATIATGELSDGDKSSLKSNYGYSASVLPGVMLSDHTLAFARVGVVRTHFVHSKATSTGGQLGLGLQTSLTQNVDLRGEYDFTASRSVKHNGVETAPRSDAFTVGLVYKFD